MLLFEKMFDSLDLLWSSMLDSRLQWLLISTRNQKFKRDNNYRIWPFGFKILTQMLCAVAARSKIQMHSVPFPSICHLANVQLFLRPNVSFKMLNGSKSETLERRLNPALCVIHLFQNNSVAYFKSIFFSLRIFSYVTWLFIM